MRLRLVMLLSAVLLALCLTLALVSLRVAFAVNWRGEVVGASNGVALWGHYKLRRRPLSVSYDRIPTSPGIIPGFSFAGFHYYRSTGLRLIGVPLWFPSCLGAIALFASARSWRRRQMPPGLCPVCHYDLRATPGRYPECGTEIATGR